MSDGLVVTSVELDEVENVASQPAVVPPTKPFELAGTGETLHVYESDVEIRLPLVYNAMPVGVDDAGRRAVPVSGTVRWQSCDDTTCHIPRTERFSVSVPVGNANIPTRTPGFLDDQTRPDPA